MKFCTKTQALTNSLRTNNDGTTAVGTEILNLLMNASGQL